MLRRRRDGGQDAVGLTRGYAPRLALGGVSIGALAGFFGIAGGFLIVPALIASAFMSMTCAVGSSRVAVAAFSATTAMNYAPSGWLDRPLAAAFLACGVGGGLIGVRAGRAVAIHKDLLNQGFVCLLFLVAYSPCRAGHS